MEHLFTFRCYFRGHPTYSIWFSIFMCLIMIFIDLYSWVSIRFLFYLFTYFNAWNDLTLQCIIDPIFWIFESWILRILNLGSDDLRTNFKCNRGRHCLNKFGLPLTSAFHSLRVMVGGGQTASGKDNITVTQITIDLFLGISMRFYEYLNVGLKKRGKVIMVLGGKTWRNHIISVLGDPYHIETKK